MEISHIVSHYWREMTTAFLPKISWDASNIKSGNIYIIIIMLYTTNRIIYKKEIGWVIAKKLFS